MLLLDGKIARDFGVAALRGRVRALGFIPKLAIVQIGALDRSRAYIVAKQRFAETIGVDVELVGLPSNIFTEDVLAEL